MRRLLPTAPMRMRPRPTTKPRGGGVCSLGGGAGAVSVGVGVMSGLGQYPAAAWLPGGRRRRALYGTPLVIIGGGK